VLNTENGNGHVSFTDVSILVFPNATKGYVARQFDRGQLSVFFGAAARIHFRHKACYHQAICVACMYCPVQYNVSLAMQGSSVLFRRRQRVNEVRQSGPQGVAKRPVVAHDHVLRQGSGREICRLAPCQQAENHLLPIHPVIHLEAENALLC
jgi:hypothetical protein